MNKLVDLHFASGLEELNKYAEGSTGDLRKIQRPLELAKKLLLATKTSTDDDEKTYVLLYRFLKTYHYLLKSDDKDYITKLLGTDAAKATKQLNILSQRLSLRYSDKKQKEEETLIAVIEAKSVADTKSTVFNNEPFISCIDLYEVLSNSNHNILVIDVRSEEHFQASHLKPSINCINIPEDVIHYGLSANTLGRYVPAEFRDHWDRRDSFDCIVLMDWKTSSYQFTGSRLHKLKVIMSEWDVNRTYHEKPTILNKGYLEFVEMYPTMCITMDDSQMMTMMDDIVDLTEINYPMESNRREDTLSISHRELPSGASDHLEDIEELVSIYDIDKDVALDTPIDDVALPFEELADWDKSSTSLEGTVNVEDLLAAARQAKKPVLTDAKSAEAILEPDEKPVVDRSTKPSITDLSLSQRWQCRDSYVGLTGLVNINNTCYMNTVIQCLRHLYPIMEFCFDSNYMEKVYRSVPKIVVNFVDLVRTLWEYKTKAHRPISFYNQFIKSFNMYGSGHHEDATEFFIHLFSSLNEDCTQPEAKETIQYDPPSYFIEMFYYKLNVAYGCVNCMGKMKSKSEYENILYLTAPNKPFDLSTTIDFYLHQERFQCKHCEKSYCYEKSFVAFPKIMTIALKRHVQTGVVRGHVPVFSKNESPCKFAYEIDLDDQIYSLKAIILHSGTVNAGHYTAVCKNHYDEKWYLFNDESVSLANMYSTEIAKSAYAFFYCMQDE